MDRYLDINANKCIVHLLMIVCKFEIKSNITRNIQTWWKEDDLARLNDAVFHLVS